MPGPAPQDRKHGRTPNTLSNGEWREYEDAPFEGAPPMPSPPGRRVRWHSMAVETWETAAVMPHCVDWRPEDWLLLKQLIFEVDLYYNTADAKKKTAQLTEMRRIRNLLGIGDQGRKEQKIRYVKPIQPGLPGAGPDDTRDVVDTSPAAPPPAGVIPMKDRRKAILDRNKPAAQADPQTA